MHGGKSKRGVEAGSYKTGKYSKHVPKSLMAFYEASQADPEYKDLKENIKLREAFIREKLSMIEDAPESGAVWASFRKTLTSFRKAWANEDYGRAQIELDELDRIVDERLVYFEVQKEIRSDLSEQRKDHQALASIEYRGENAATMSDLLTFASVMFNLVSTHVSNMSEQQRIYDAISEIIGTQESDTPAVITISDEAS